MEASRKGKKSKKVVDPETKKLLAEQKVHAKMAKSQMKRKKVTAYREKSTFGNKIYLFFTFSTYKFRLMRS